MPCNQVARTLSRKKYKCSINRNMAVGRNKLLIKLINGTNITVWQRFEPCCLQYRVACYRITYMPIPTHSIFTISTNPCIYFNSITPAAE